MAFEREDALAACRAIPRLAIKEAERMEVFIIIDNTLFLVVLEHFLLIRLKM